MPGSVHLESPARTRRGSNSFFKAPKQLYFCAFLQKKKKKKEHLRPKLEPPLGPSRGSGPFGGREEEEGGGKRARRRRRREEEEEEEEKRGGGRGRCQGREGTHGGAASHIAAQLQETRERCRCRGAPRGTPSRALPKSFGVGERRLGVARAPHARREAEG